jgi:hypothetical protein
MWPAIAVVLDPSHMAFLHRAVFVFVFGPKRASHVASFHTLFDVPASFIDFLVK